MEEYSKSICKGCPMSAGGRKCVICQRAKLQNIAVGEMPEGLPPDPAFSRYGISVDIGTTTVCASLLGMDGKIETVAGKNPQVSFGTDVISRIESAMSGEGGKLAQCIRKLLCTMTAELCARRGIEPEFVDALTITGNTAMLYLLTGHDPAGLSRAPFVADRLFGEFIRADELGLNAAPDARVYLARCVSAFVGGDVACAVLASGMCDHDRTAMLIDVGTNGEIALWHGGKLICCSTAAGPALEGAGITHGVYGQNGAIDRVWQAGGRIRCSTIGGVPAVGICGSGIVDAAAAMLELGVIDETGAFSGGGDAFALTDDVCITGADVRKVQLAKGAVRAGIETLLETQGVTATPQVDTLHIAGGFGSRINLQNAAAIGLIPAWMTDRAKVAGNAAHTGATMLLRDKSLVDTLHSLAAKAHTVPLDANPVFTEHYMNYIAFAPEI